MRLLPWLATGALSFLLAFSLLHARAEYRGYLVQRESLRSLQQKLASLHVAQAQLADRKARVTALESLRGQAASAGLAPAAYMVSQLDISAEADAKELVSQDPTIRELEQEKSDKLLRAQAVAPSNGSGPMTQAAPKEIERIAAQYDLLIKQRRDALALERRFDAARLRSLLTSLSAAGPLETGPQSGRAGYWFLPETLRVTRVAGDGFAVDARGVFLIAR